MYAFALVVCLLSEPDKCTTFVEDPPLYYETVDECNRNMIIKANAFIKQLSANNILVKMGGQCIRFPDIKSA